MTAFLNMLRTICNQIQLYLFINLKMKIEAPTISFCVIQKVNKC